MGFGPEGENSFPFGKRERKEELALKVKALKTFKATKAEHVRGGRYWWTDSHANEPVGGSPSHKVISFQESFENVLPAGTRSLTGYIENAIGKNAVIGIEFGGLGINFFSDFSRGFFKKSISVTLVDHRSISEIHADRKKLKLMNHEIIKGDINSDKLYDSLRQQLKGEKADVIVERMGEGLEFVPVEPFTVGKIFQEWYGLLSERGILIVQVPVALSELLKPWTTMLRGIFKNKLDISESWGMVDDNPNCSALRIQKMPDAPAELPMLDPRTIRRISTD